MVKARAVTIREAGGPEVLEIADHEVRDPGPTEVQVRVAAAGLNRADLLQRRGLYPAPPGYPQHIPGLELAGTVTAVGTAVQSLSVGDRVMGITGGGGMATHLVAPERELMRVPAALSLRKAAAIPEVFLTAYDALFVQAGLRVGQVALLHAVASGVGTAALQLVRAAGAIAVGTSRSADKLERCRELGLDHPVQVQQGSFADGVKQATGGRRVDVVLDLVGGQYLGENLRVLASRGRIVVVGLVGGIQGELPLGVLLSKRAQVIGTVLRSRPPEEKAALTQRFAQEVLPMFDAGRLQPIVDEVLPMGAVADAHRRMEDNRTFGKLVLSWDD